jgi:DNA polymerase-3 subunit alpha
MAYKETILCGLSTTATPLGGLSDHHTDQLIEKFSKSGKRVVPVLLDYCSLLGAVEFEASCAKHGVQGLVGTRISLEHKDNILGDVILMAKNQQGYNELAEVLTSVNHHQHNLDKIKYTDSDLSLGKWVYKTCLPKDLSTLSQNIQVVLPKKGQLLSNLAGDTELEALQGRLAHSKSAVALGSASVEQDSLYLHQVVLSDASPSSLFSDFLSKTHKGIPKSEFALGNLEQAKAAHLYGNAKDTDVATRKATASFVNQCKPIQLLEEEEMPDVDFKIDVAAESRKLLEAKLEANPNLNAAVYRNYLKHELSVLEQIDGMGYYQTIIAFAKFLQERDVTFRIRGSASASLIFNLHGVSSKLTDPIQQGLVLARFITSGRMEKPDVDIDIPTDQRHLFIEFMEQHFGKGVVAAFANKNAKSSFRELMQTALELQSDPSVTHLTNSDIQALDREIRDEIEAFDPKDMHLSNVLERSEKLKSVAESNHAIGAVLESAKEISNWHNSLTSHQSGMIFSPDKSFKLPRLQNAVGGSVIECTKPARVGFVKFDILSSKNVQLLREVNNILKKRGGQVDMPDTFSEEFFQYFSQNTAFLNQMGGNSMKRTLVKMQPKNVFELLVSMALPRPILSSQDRQEFYARQTGKPLPNMAMFSEPKVMDILAPTQGFVLFDEQILELCGELAGLDESYSDQIRTAIKKNKLAEFQELRSVFVDGAKEQGVSEVVASQTYDVLEKSVGRYSFPKAHALSYATIAMEQAYCKLMYPDAAFTAINKVYPYSSTEKVAKKYAELVDELKSRGIEFSCPSISRSARDDFSLIKVDGNSVMYAPLSPIFKGVEQYGDVILEGVSKLRSLGIASELTLQDYIDFSSQSFFEAFDGEQSKLKDAYKDCINRLIYFGAFDETGFTRSIPVCESRISAREQLMGVVDGYIDDVCGDFPSMTFSAAEIDIDVLALTQLESRMFGCAVTQESRPLKSELKVTEPKMEVSQDPKNEHQSRNRARRMP